MSVIIYINLLVFAFAKFWFNFLKMLIIYEQVISLIRENVETAYKIC